MDTNLSKLRETVKNWEVLQSIGVTQRLNNKLTFSQGKR